MKMFHFVEHQPAYRLYFQNGSELKSKFLHSDQRVRGNIFTTLCLKFETRGANRDYSLIHAIYRFLYKISVGTYIENTHG